MSSRWFWSVVRVPAVVLGLLLLASGTLDLAGLNEDVELPRSELRRIVTGLLTFVAGLALALPYSRVGRPLRLACMFVVGCLMVLSLNLVMQGAAGLWREQLHWGALASSLVFFAITAGSMLCLRAYSGRGALVGTAAGGLTSERPRSLAQDVRVATVSALLLGSSTLASYHATHGLDTDPAWTFFAFLVADWPIWPVLALLPAAATPRSVMRSLACVVGAAVVGTIIGIVLVVSTTCMIFDLRALLAETWTQLRTLLAPGCVALLIGLAWRETGGWPHPEVTR